MSENDAPLARAATSPFRALGLLATATDDEIRTRLDLLAGPSRDAAERLLSDPVLRLREELHWRHTTATPAQCRGSAIEHAVAVHAVAIHATLDFVDDRRPAPFLNAWREVERDEWFWHYLRLRAAAAGVARTEVDRMRDLLLWHAEVTVSAREPALV